MCHVSSSLVEMFSNTLKPFNAATCSSCWSLPRGRCPYYQNPQREVRGHTPAFLHLVFTNQKYLRSLHQRSDRTQEAVAHAFCFFHYRVQMLQSTDWKLYMAGQWPSVRCCSVGLLGQIVYNSSLILLVAASRKNIIFLSCGICGCNCFKCKIKQLLAFLSFSADC